TKATAQRLNHHKPPHSKNATRYESLLSNLLVHALILFMRSKILKSGMIRKALNTEVRLAATKLYRH
ncbi:hypothetical protein, partial [Vibrio parahaemolyticus]|uniref:hypothetical protein n=1 Tax=Vibrio parahaemolyticus TaxID=670 RepID=UPI001C60B6DB